MTAKKVQSPPRAPLTTQQLEQITAHDFVKLKLSEDEKLRLKKINEERQREREQRSARLAIEEKPILADLHEIGLDVESVWDLVNIPNNYTTAVPILLKHLLLAYSDRTRAGIARALAVPEASQAWKTLVSEYRNASMGTGIVAPGDVKELRLGAKDGLACALSVAVTDETLPELISLAKDPSHGESRILLLSALRKSKNPIAKKAIEELSFDPGLEKEISSWSRKKTEKKTH